MTYEKGNQLWKLRLKHGRDCAIETPEQLWENACEYFQWCIDNPLIEIDYRGKDLQMVEIPHPRVFTKPGFAVACGLSEWDRIADYKKRSSDFCQVIEKIERIIYDQKFAGAAAGMFKENIIARDLGLKDRQETTGSVQIVIDKDDEKL